MVKQDSSRTNIGTSESQSISKKLKDLLEERKKAKREPLTRDKLRKSPGLENLTDVEADEAIETLQKLAAIFYQAAVHQENLEKHK